MYKALVNNKVFEIQPDGNNWTVNGIGFAPDLVSLGDGRYHIIHNNMSYRTEIIKVDRAAKTIDLKVNGVRYAVQIRDQFDELLEKMGMNGAGANKVMMVKAPMPGLIVDLRVSPGTAVKTGDPLLVLEAMKMENVIKASGDGIVKLVKVKKGDSVEKGQMLIEF